MHVKVTPVGRKPYWLDAMPTFETLSAIGCGTLSLDTMLTPSQKERFGYADVRVYGTDGLCWHGFGWQVPRSGAIVCQGLGAVLGFSYRGRAVSTSKKPGELLAGIHTDVTTDNAWALPDAAYLLAAVGEDSATTIGSIERSYDADFATYKDAIRAHSPYVYGWYPEPWAGRAVPHYSAPPTAKYIIDVRDAITWELNDVDMEPLYSRERVGYTDANGDQQVKEYTATSGYLTDVGVLRTHMFTISGQTEGDADYAGARALAIDSAVALAGSVTTADVRTTTGAPVPLSTIRSDERVIVHGLDSGVRQATIVKSAHTGETSVNLTLDAHSYALDVALARMAARVRK